MPTSRFLVDAMLGDLARGLRALGLDAEYADSKQSDEDIVARAASEGRAVVTRDLDLAQRARKLGLDTALLKSLPLEEQLVLTLTHLGVHLDAAAFYTRCILCNSTLAAVEKQDLPSTVPAAIRQRHDAFTRCPTCERIYWPGTHVESMDARLRTVLEAMAGPDVPTKR